MKVDNYTATLPTPAGSDVFDWLVDALPQEAADSGLEVVPGFKATYNYGAALAVKIDGDVVGVVRWGGNGDGTSVDLKGAIAHEVYGLLRARWPEHRVTRCDVAIDRVAPGLFERTYNAMRELAGSKRPRVQLRHEGDWTWRERPGLSCYFGSTQSDFHLVLYEKDAELEAKKRIAITDETRGWTRLEVRCLPKKKQLGTMVAALSPPEIIGLYPYGRDAVSIFDGFEAKALKRPPRLSSEERTYQALLAQYGAFLLKHPERLDSIACDIGLHRDFRAGKKLSP